MTFKRLNNITGWLAGLIATVVYLLTLEPTVSWWDCGEYISTAYKLQVETIRGLFSIFYKDVSQISVLLQFGISQNKAKNQQISLISL